MSEREKDARIWSDVIHLMPAWTWEADADYRLRYVNIRHSGLQLTAQQLNGLCILDQASATGDEAGLDRLMEALRDQREVRGLSYERVMVNGDRAVLMDSAVPIWTVQGVFAGYRGITLNISAVMRKADVTDSLVAGLNKRTVALERNLVKKAHELSETNHLLTEIVEGMGEGLLVTSGTQVDDPDNQVLRVNPAYLRLFGLQSADVPEGMAMGDHLHFLAQHDKVPRDPTVHREVEDALNKGRKVLMEIPDSGRSYYMQASSRPMLGNVIVHTDITDLRNQNAELRAARDAANVANKAKSSFLANMSHEIRTPMNGVVGMADLLAETDLSSEQASYVATIRGAALALTSLISDILDFSKVEAGRLELEKVTFEVAGLVDEISELLSPLATQKELTLQCRIDPDVPHLVEGDALRIRQILMNLMGNAIKFTLEGKVDLHLSRTSARDNVVRFTLTDTGIGIPADRLAVIFDPFEQVHKGHERQFEGTGLGLSICKRLVSAMQGTISARSEEGRGTTFTVDLPLPTVAFSTPSAVPVSTDTMRLDGLCVLVVEDNRTNQAVAQKMLERRGAQVVLADNGRRALDLYDPHRFALVLMDLSMPEMSGLEATRLIREREQQRGWPHRPIIALTGNAFDKDRDDAAAAGMDGFLSKPVRRDALLLTIAAHLCAGSDHAAAS
ncbi:ATP-binding protein [Antarctobacter heliothermus]|uniref:Sensory/regulatory protein RpfC n=1 Tax=Antarctobacter heliothermus TaxID=74033 RepID=A0A239EXT5_9RHOB|nr:ATP-binding protein [Antarctobacter heliothermus]SNS49241.1 PAS fold [Antarctobacter heliothermus]